MQVGLTKEERLKLLKMSERYAYKIKYEEAGALTIVLKGKGRLSHAKGMGDYCSRRPKR